jgi:hypothetical protein
MTNPAMLTLASKPENVPRTVRKEEKEEKETKEEKREERRGERRTLPPSS